MLKDLSIKDIYLGKTSAFISGIPGKSDPIPAPDDCKNDLDEIRVLCQEGEESGHIEFPITHRDVDYRVSVMESMSETVYVLRRFPPGVLPLSQLGLHPKYVEHLLTPDVSGLIIIAGAFGQGKTWTASSTVASRLIKYGGVAITVEDPPEMPLEGLHGEGVCYQTWVKNGQFGEGCRRAARYAPSIIFLGEVRDHEAASEALRASINGRLVICTTHAQSVHVAIERMYSLAVGGGGSPDDMSSLLASGLLCVLHQSLVDEPKRPKCEFLWLSNDDSSSGVRSMIKQRKFEQIKSEIKLQQNRMVIGR